MFRKDPNRTCPVCQERMDKTLAHLGKHVHKTADGAYSFKCLEGMADNSWGDDFSAMLGMRVHMAHAHGVAPGGVVSASHAKTDFDRMFPDGLKFSGQ